MARWMTNPDASHRFADGGLGSTLRRETNTKSFLRNPFADPQAKAHPTSSTQKAEGHLGGFQLRSGDHGEPSVLLLRGTPQTRGLAAVPPCLSKLTRVSKAALGGPFGKIDGP